MSNNSSASSSTTSAFQPYETPEEKVLLNRLKSTQLAKIIGNSGRQPTDADKALADCKAREQRWLLTSPASKPGYYDEEVWTCHCCHKKARGNKWLDWHGALDKHYCPKCWKPEYACV